MSALSFRPQGAGSVRLEGELSFATAPVALREAAPWLGAPGMRFDLSGVVKADSAGVALLIEWLREARHRGGDLRYAGVPERLRAMIRVCGLAGLLALDDTLADPSARPPRPEP